MSIVEGSAFGTKASELVAKAQRLVVVYRRIASNSATPQDLQAAGCALGRALEALENQGARQGMDRAETEIASAHETLERIRTALNSDMANQRRIGGGSPEDLFPAVHALTHARQGTLRQLYIGGCACCGRVRPPA